MPATATAPPPSRDETCASCASPSTTECPFNPKDADYVTGDIVVMHESVHTPIDLIFAASTQSNRGLAPGPARSNASRSANSNRLKARPAVVWDDDFIDTDDAGPDARTTVACLLASLEGLCTYNALPDILKNHIGLPVSPHCEIREGGPHLHTSPEWRKDHVWLIGYSYKTSGQVLGRWQWQDENGKRDAKRSFRVEEGEFFKMRAVCEKRMAGWMKLCVTNEEYVADCKRQYDIFRKSKEWTKHLMTQSWVEQRNDSDDSGYITGVNELKMADPVVPNPVVPNPIVPNPVMPNPVLPNPVETPTISSSSASKSEKPRGSTAKPIAERIRGVLQRRGKGRGHRRTAPTEQNNDENAVDGA